MKSTYIVVKQGLKQRNKELIKKRNTICQAKDKTWRKWRKLSKPPIKQMKEKKNNKTKTKSKEMYQNTSQRVNVENL